VETAFAIAKQLGIANSMNECITGDELEKMSDEKLGEQCEDLSVFARVSPTHKVRIVKAFRARGNVAAMTGDGVNDAPSLKSADIGIAMGKCGTDVAKNAADIILTDDNFATIEKAIEEGRGIYENIKKSVLFLLSSNFGEIITMFLAVSAGLSSPLKASHILWVNLITDSLPALALGVDENDGKMLMDKPPRNSTESLFAGGGLFLTLFYGCLIAAVSLIAFFSVPYAFLNGQGAAFTLGNIRAALSYQEVLMRAQTYAFTVLGISELFHAIGMRNVEKSFFTNHPFSNKLMIAAFTVGIGLQVLVTEIPYFNAAFETVHLSFSEWMGLIFMSSMPLIAHEIMLLNPAFRLKKFHKSKENKKKTAEPGKI
jgi:Ca2+-transporting ATPase